MPVRKTPLYSPFTAKRAFVEPSQSPSFTTPNPTETPISFNGPSTHARTFPRPRAPRPRRLPWSLPHGYCLYHLLVQHSSDFRRLLFQPLGQLLGLEHRPSISSPRLSLCCSATPVGSGFARSRGSPLRALGGLQTALRSLRKEPQLAPGALETARASHFGARKLRLRGSAKVRRRSHSFLGRKKGLL